MADDGPRLGYTIFAIRAAPRDPAIRRNTVILDNGANTSRFANRRLTRYIRPDDSVGDITAFGGQVIACGESGMLPGFLRIGLNIEFDGNVLALTDIERTATVKYLQNNRYIVTTQRGVRYDFVKGYGTINDESLITKINFLFNLK